MNNMVGVFKYEADEMGIAPLKRGVEIDRV
jgi:hypothetical protein